MIGPVEGNAGARVVDLGVGDPEIRQDAILIVDGIVCAGNSDAVAPADAVARILPRDPRALEIVGNDVV